MFLDGIPYIPVYCKDKQFAEALKVYSNSLVPSMWTLHSEKNIMDHFGLPLGFQAYPGFWLQGYQSETDPLACGQKPKFNIFSTIPHL